MTGRVVALVCALLSATACGGSPAAAPTAQVYVAPDGDDTAAGTSDAPLRTPQAGVRRLADGGTVHLAAGTYAGQRIVLRDRHDLTITGPADGVATLDATGLTPPDGDSGVVEIEDSRHVTVRHLEVTGYRTRSLDKVPIGLYVTGSGTDITLVGNHVHDLGNDNRTRGSYDINAHGIAAYGRDWRTPITGLHVRDNEVDHLHLGASESVVVNGNVSGWDVTGNRVHDDDNIGIDAIGYEETLPGRHRWTRANRARHGRIVGNTVSDIADRGNPTYWEDGAWCTCADGIYVDGGADIEIRDNVVRTSDIGLEVGAEDPRGHTDGVRVQDNEVTGSRYAGLALGGYGPRRGEVYDVTVSGNTVAGGAPAALLQYHLHQVEVTGNRIVSSGSDVLERVRRVGTARQNAAVRLDHNSYGGVAPAPQASFTWLSREVTGFAAYRVRSGQDAHSTYHRG